jgi:hypothetical protein
MGLPALFQLSSGITGQAKDRPIGLTQAQGGYNFNAKSMVLTYETATLATQNDFGKGPGVLAVDFQDPADIGSGQYTAYIQIERVDTTKPQISITTPPQGATYTVGQTVAADYSCTDADSGVASCEGVQPVGELENSVADGANIDTSSPGTKTFTVSAADNAGNTNSVSHTYTVNAQTTAPKVMSTSPANGATGIASSVNVTATFSEAMDAITTDGDPSTINGTTFKLVRLSADGTTTRVTAAVSYAAATKKAILNPSSNLSSGRTYKATVTTGAQDLAGTALDQDQTPSNGNQPKSWKFKVQ